MYSVTTHSNPITQELLALSREYGIAPRFIRARDRRGASLRCLEFTFGSASERQAFEGFLTGRGFQATLSRSGDADSCRLVCRAAVFG